MVSRLFLSRAKRPISHYVCQSVGPAFDFLRFLAYLLPLPNRTRLGCRVYGLVSVRMLLDAVHSKQPYPTPTLIQNYSSMDGARAMKFGKQSVHALLYTVKT